jgi:hypothetical protein
LAGKDKWDVCGCFGYISFGKLEISTGFTGKGRSYAWINSIGYSDDGGKTLGVFEDLLK